jgi:phosphoribosylformylglycinamidine cyclo-ligase
VFNQFKVNGVAHITGGGFIENIPRMLPEGLAAEIDYGSWPVHRIFDLIEEKGNLTRKEMFTTFNMGIGMVLSVSEENMVPVIRLLEETGEKPYIIGRVKQGEGVIFGGGSIE